MKPEDFLLVQPQQDRAFAKFHKMVQAASEILAEDGFGGLTSDAIAARAGVNISTFYKYFANRDAVLGYMAVAFIEEQTASLQRLIARMPPDAPLEQVIPAMIDTAVDDWTSNPTSRALQGCFILDPVLYAEYSQSSLIVAAALRPFITVWNIAGTHDDWDRMHSVFGDCAIVLYDRAAKAEPAEQAEVVIQLKNLAVAYFKTAVAAP
ncbi:TetR/AcrR family transcriptional regulator [Pararhodobacter zhoushanensis]|uniref:TetR/AcrR family transcriptional regulator n=1 Tax=Pararhodobacter zhoushanensis TaxID=2479545 RepID=A0ABT3H244_9RHOB|nr:TetR/AcrR family transcriptional regulator [Pararhodobacter zhoushanensis]MCW1933828.1 TetR/AcrR family transcriptional regulator [Pararhodobacter zhoushanensis]